MEELDGTKEQFILLCPLRPQKESKGAKSPLCHVPGLCILIVLGNFLIIITVTVSKTLNSPVYFFLASLVFMDVTSSSSTTCRLISDFSLRGVEGHIF